MNNFFTIWATQLVIGLIVLLVWLATSLKLCHGLPQHKYLARAGKLFLCAIFLFGFLAGASDFDLRGQTSPNSLPGHRQLIEHGKITQVDDATYNNRLRHEQFSSAVHLIGIAALIPLFLEETMFAKPEPANPQPPNTDPPTPPNSESTNSPPPQKDQPST